MAEEEKGNVKERNVVIPLSWMKSHSSVNFSPSNPIRSTAHPAMAYGTAEQGGIKRDKHSKESWESLEEGHEKCLKCLAANEERQNLNKATLQFMMWQLQHL